MKIKTVLHDVADIMIIMFATSSIILIIAKLYNFSFVKDIDSTTLVAIPASIFAYFTYRISEKQTHHLQSCGNQVEIDQTMSIDRFNDCRKT
jgi:hypothetical protein